MTIPYTIRQADERDANLIAQLHAESWRSAYRGILTDVFLDGPVDTDRLRVWCERFSKAMAGQMFVLIAENDGKAVGFICVVPAADQTFGSFVDNLHVRPHLTSRGIGRLLLSEAAKRLLAEESSGGVFLWVLEKNEKAWRFYERVGGIHTDSVMRSMPDGRKILARRYHWASAALLI